MRAKVIERSTVPSGGAARDLRRDLAQAIPTGDGFDRTTRGVILHRRRVRQRRWDGTAWVYGIEFTGLNSDPSKPYIHLDVSGATPAAYESDVGPFVNGDGRRQSYDNIEIYEKAKLVEPPHVTRF